MERELCTLCTLWRQCKPANKFFPIKFQVSRPTKPFTSACECCTNTASLQSSPHIRTIPNAWFAMNQLKHGSFRPPVTFDSPTCMVKVSPNCAATLPVPWVWYLHIFLQSRPPLRKRVKISASTMLIIMNSWNTSTQWPSWESATLPYHPSSHSGAMRSKICGRISRRQHGRQGSFTLLSWFVLQASSPSLFFFRMLWPTIHSQSMDPVTLIIPSAYCILTMDGNPQIYLKSA